MDALVLHPWRRGPGGGAGRPDDEEAEATGSLRSGDWPIWGVGRGLAIFAFTNGCVGLVVVVVVVRFVAVGFVN